ADRAARDEVQLAASPVRYVALGEDVGRDGEIAVAGLEAPEPAAAARHERAPSTVGGDQSEELQLRPRHDPDAAAAPRIAGGVGVDRADDDVSPRLHVEQATVSAHQVDEVAQDDPAAGHDVDAARVTHGAAAHGEDACGSVDEVSPGADGDGPASTRRRRV